MTNQCDRYTAAGSRCELPHNHPGDHQKTNDGWTFTWTDQSQTDLINRYGGTKGT